MIGLSITLFVTGSETLCTTCTTWTANHRPRLIFYASLEHTLGTWNCSYHVDVWAHLEQCCVAVTSNPQPPDRGQHGCTVGIDRDPPVWHLHPGRAVEVPEHQLLLAWLPVEWLLTVVNASVGHRLWCRVVCPPAHLLDQIRCTAVMGDLLDTIFTNQIVRNHFPSPQPTDSHCFCCCCWNHSHHWTSSRMHGIQRLGFPLEL